VTDMNRAGRRPVPLRAKGQATLMTSPVRDRARRRWRWLAVAALAIIAGLVAALPWLLTMPAAQRRIAAAANKILAPGSVEFSEVRLSWFRPTQIANAVLRDAQ
jgi:autotransporter translocation and assembly factor TamB